jgi:hypothetical protein
LSRISGARADTAAGSDVLAVSVSMWWLPRKLE